MCSTFHMEAVEILRCGCDSGGFETAAGAPVRVLESYKHATINNKCVITKLKFAGTLQRQHQDVRLMFII